MGSFYAVIKFKTKEEIICFVSEANPEQDYLVITDPVEIEEVDIPGVIQGLKLKAWMKIAQTNTFQISGEDILTMVEASPPVIKMYNSSLKKLDQVNSPKKNIKKPSIRRRKKGNKVNLSLETGLLGSIEDAREILEEMYLMDPKDIKES
jgi:hypothetical protein